MLWLYNSMPFIFISSKTIVDLQQKNIKMTVIQYIWGREALFSLIMPAKSNASRYISSELWSESSWVIQWGPDFWVCSQKQKCLSSVLVRRPGTCWFLRSVLYILVRFLSVLCLVGSFPQAFVVHRSREAGGLAPFVERPMALAGPLFPAGERGTF